MRATLIDGTAIARRIRERIRDDIKTTQRDNPTYKPSLTIIQVGQRPDSSTYVRMKRKALDEANINCNVSNYDESIGEAEILEDIWRLNKDPSTHGILVQLPLPGHLSERAITSAVAEEKDVDGFSTTNIGELAKRRGQPRFTPCTPAGVMVLLRESGVELSGRDVVVLGRSDIVGGPVSYLLKAADATVTMCHAKTRGIEDFVGRADVVVAAIGKPHFVKGEWLKPGAVVIDVGTNYIPDESKKSGQRLVGDVHFDSAAEVASMITPVPGGVGPMTVAMLLQNVVDAASRTMDSASSS
ncbi:MAG: tetrahydrofolate synthase [Thelocarpon impressellum]|nr:MAG: tetrahydrofolate synthase [Thelocarpon impressellum]